MEPVASSPSDSRESSPVTRPARLSVLLTALLVIPCGSVAVLYMLQIEVIDDPQPRRLIASAAVCLAPVVLFVLRVLEDMAVGGGRRAPVWSWVVWFVTTVALVAVPLAARLGLGTRPSTSGAARGVRDLAWPTGSDLLLALVAGLGVATLLAIAGLAIARLGTTVTILAGLAAAAIGYVTVPVTFVGLALTYDVVVGPGDDPFADAAQTLSIIWFVAVPMTGLLAGLSAAGRLRPR